MPSPVRPGRPRPPIGRGKQFNLRFFALTIVTAACLFAGTIAFIRFWQRRDPLEAWTRGHPRLNPQPGRERSRGNSKASWLGAEASSLDFVRLLARAPAVGPERPSEWWSQEREQESFAFENPFPEVDAAHAVAAKRTPASRTPLVSRKERVQETHDSQAEVEAVGAAHRAAKPQRRYPVTRDDLVIAIPTHKATEPQLRAGRAARLGIRTVVVTNYTETEGRPYPRGPGEAWTHYPDAHPARSFYAGDDRAALAPFIAFRALGDSFRWLFYGDDDTVLFADAALALAGSLDADVPYFVTDNLWFSGLGSGASHPHPLAPRCLPCGFDKNVTAAVGMEMVPGCPCTPALICQHKAKYNGTFSHGGCGAPRPPSRAYSMHGGAGALISIGLLRQIDWTSMERCVNHQWSSGGDAFITVCLWEQGFAHTTPDPAWHPAGLQMFDPSPPGLNPDDFIAWKAGHVVGNMLQDAAGVCRGLCRLEVDSTVTVHLRARRTSGSDEGAAAFVRSFSRLIGRLSGRLTPDVGKRILDVTSPRAEALADAIDAEYKAAIDAVGKLLRLQEGQHANATARAMLDLNPGLGVVSAEDAVRAGVADAVAARLLRDTMRLAEPLAAAADPEPRRSKAAGLPGGGVDDLVAERNRAA